MACTVVANWDLCTEGGSTGGIDEIKLLKADEFDSVTVGTEGEITAITLTAGATEGFQDIDFISQGAQDVDSIAVTNQGTNVVDTNTLTVIVPKQTQAKWKFVLSITDCVCGLIIYYKDLNGEEWLLGTEGKKQRAYVTQIDADTGLAFTDANQITFTFTTIGKVAKRNANGITLPTV